MPSSCDRTKQPLSTLAGLVLMRPLLLLIGVVGLVIAGLAMLTSWIVDQAVKWYEGGQSGAREST
jgi:hypothetical protein